MKNKPPEEANELLVQLYALSHEQPIEGFQNAALILLKPVIAFDAAIWGTATTGLGGIDIHTCHLHNKTPEMVADYEEVKHLDSASSSMFERPKATMAFQTNAFFAGRDKRPIRDFMTKFEQPHFVLSTDLKAQASGASSLLHWLTLYRAKQGAHYDATDVKRLHLLAPHLKQALALNRASYLGKTAATREGRSLRATAIVDSKGFILSHDDQLMVLVSKACGEDYTKSMQLPPELVAQLSSGKKVCIWQHLVVRWHAEHGLIIVKLRTQTVVDTLTDREREIALLVAKGRTYKQVAGDLCKAPATVRNQIQKIYSKLEVKNIAELVEALLDVR